MITPIHTLIYSDDAVCFARPRARPRCGCGHVAPLPEGSILRDVLGWKYVTEDWDNDWLIFKSGPSEMGVHPTHSVWEGKLMITRDSTRSRSCAMTSMRRWMSGGRKARSSEAPIEQREYSRVIMMIVPGAGDLQLYQPAHKLTYNLSHKH